MFSEITTLVVSSVQYDIFLMFKYKLRSWCSRSNFNKKNMQQQFKLSCIHEKKNRKKLEFKSIKHEKRQCVEKN